MDDQAYLEPGFDPSTLNMPRLRSILVAHNIHYPASAKKSQLVDIFNEHILPQARQLRAANSRVKRTSRGIENVPSSASTADDDEPPNAVTRSARRSTRARTEEAQDVEPTPRVLRHSTAPPDATPRRPSSKHPRAADGQDVAERDPKRPASRGSRLNAVTPVMRKTEDEADQSNFSNENVFQSGSSPPVPKSRDADRRRTMTTASRELDRRRSREVRRRTDDIRPVREQLDGAVLPTRRTFEMSVAHAKKEEVEASEEFTPEEQLELMHAQQAGELATVRPRPRRPGSSAAKTAPWAIAIATLLGVAAVWRQEKLEVGYCGIGRPSTELAGVQIPDWAEFIRPQCEPCPPHAFCGDRLETECEPDFVYTPHPLSLGGLVPLPPTCEPDSAKARKVDIVKKRAVEELREQNAKFECGDAPSPDIKEADLKQTLGTKRRKGMTNEEFEELWAIALGEIKNAEEVVSGADGSGHFTLRSTSLASLPLACAIRRSLRETLREYFWQLVMIASIFSGVVYTRHSIASARATEEKANQLAGLALGKLSRQAALHRWDPDMYREDYISVAHLRDDILREDWSATRRKKLWEKVQTKVEKNSNVRSMVKEGRSGDVGRVWEWVGAVEMIENGSSPPGSSGYIDRRRSGHQSRVNFSGFEERLVGPRDNLDLNGMQKWEEPGKYY